MLIDWFTVGAQALNFLILVWLLKRFLYQPILDAIDAREQRIAAELADAEAKQTEAQQERDDFRQRNREFDEARTALLRQATDKASAEGRRLLDEARAAADNLSTRRMQTLRDEARDLSQSISHRTQQEVFAIARKTLMDLATTDLEERLSEAFTRRLQAMDASAKDVFARALQEDSEPALVRSAFDLPEAQRATIRQAIRETFAADIPVRFETAPELVSGIELTAHGQKLAWSIADYLKSLEQRVGELLNAPATTGSASASAPGADTGREPPDAGQ